MFIVSFINVFRGLCVGNEVVFHCRDEGPLRVKVHWMRSAGRPLPPGTRDDKEGRLEIPDIRVCYNLLHFNQLLFHMPIYLLLMLVGPFR